MNKTLKSPSTVCRFQAKPLSAPGAIVTDGGRWGAGLIPGVSLCSVGEALGHGLWCDLVMLEQIVELCNANSKLLKSRFTHPGICSDGTGKSLGTIENARVEGRQVIGDMHLYKSAHNAPDGDLAGYVISLANEDPANFGLSIVFDHDPDAEDAFMLENGGHWETIDDGWEQYDVIVDFKSPDPDNVNNYRHTRLKKLWAADIVDDPAANPGGLFHRADSIGAQGREVLDFVFDRSAKAPEVAGFGIAPERLKEFVSKYMSANGLCLSKKDETMPKPKRFNLIESMRRLLSKAESMPEEDPKKCAAEDQPNPDNPDGEPDEEPGDSEVEVEIEPSEDDETEEPSKPTKTSSQSLKQFVEKFGAEHGAAWAIEGISYETALERHCDLLTAELTDANQRLSALGTQGTEPVRFSHPPKKETGTAKQSGQKLNDALGERLSRFAAGIRLPGAPNNN